MLSNLGFDEKGNGTGTLDDRYDFKKRNIKNFKDYLNNHGYNMQEKGNLENNFSIIDILISDKLNIEEKENFIKKLIKYFKLY